MPIVYHLAIIERARRGYSVFFPDLPGGTSAGDKVAEATTNAEEALAGHLLVSEEVTSWRHRASFMPCRLTRM
jgi:predicted RNase H-like HicB family nuclease